MVIPDRTGDQGPGYGHPRPYRRPLSAALSPVALVSVRRYRMS
ncbi:hypothetical protein [Candidatus Sodalis endolongispinus]|nr:hypothetical protein [Candidatus Sodalis endolongispinus]